MKQAIVFHLTDESTIWVAMGDEAEMIALANERNETADENTQFIVVPVLSLK